MRKSLLFILTMLMVVRVAAQQPDSITSSVSFEVTVTFGCVDTITLVNNSVGCDYYEWDYGDGTVYTTGDTATHSKIYNLSGAYTITLRAGNSTTGFADTVVYPLTRIEGRIQSVTVDSVHCNELYYSAASGMTHTGPGFYVDTVYEFGCRYVHQLTLHPLTTFIDTTLQLCAGLPVRVGNLFISQPGTYTDTITHPNGCDRILTIHALQAPVIVTDRHDYCQGDSILYNNMIITKSTFVDDTMKTQWGCDSIIRHIFNFHPVYNFLTTRVICSGDSVEFFGHHYSQPGIYIEHLQTVSEPHCDSIHTLNLTQAKIFRDTTDVACTVKPYKWRGKSLSQSGIYYDSLVSKAGCDSIYMLRLKFDLVRYVNISDTLCPGDFYPLGGKKHGKTGIYCDTIRRPSGTDSIITVLTLYVPNLQVFYDTADVCNMPYIYMGDTLWDSGDHERVLKDIRGCDSIIYKLRLNYLYSSIHYTSGSILNNNDNYYWQGGIYNAAGTYTKRYKDINGCDSLWVLILGYPAEHYQIYICEGDSFMLRGRAITEPGVYLDRMVNWYGYDSIDTFTVNIPPRYDFFDTVQVCQGSYYNFHGKMISQAGNHFDSCKTIRGCDSIYHLHLIVLPKFHDIEHVNVCSARPYKWRNRYLYCSGTYLDSLKTADGCDSVYELRLTLSPPVTQTINATICHGDTFTYWNRNYTEKGIFDDTLMTSEGCDSVVEIVLNVLPEYKYLIVDTICQGDTITFNGVNYTQQGVFHQRLKSVGGCDSIIEIRLTVLKSLHIVKYDTVCSSGTYSWHGMSLNTSGIYYDRNTSVTGCDSTYELHLEKYSTYKTLLQITICRGELYDFHGQKCGTTGRYFYRHISVNGCDSIEELCLNVQSGRVYTVYDTICFGKTYQFGGKTLTKTGIYYDTLPGLHGCDSIVRLVLQTHPRFIMKDIQIHLCQGESFKFGDKNYSKQGIYLDTLLSRRGCDSIVRHIVTVHPHQEFRDTVEICGGDCYMLNGKRLTNPGTYCDSLKSVLTGCDSLHKLTLIVKPSYHNVAYDTTCYDSPYLWRGRQLTATGIFRDTMPTVDGCDSVFEMRLTVFPVNLTEMHAEICHGQSYYYRGKDITNAGVYYDTLTSRHGCDSILKLSVSYLAKYLISESVEICPGTVHNFRGRDVSKPGVYWDSLRSIGGCDSIYQLTLTIKRTPTTIIDTTICSNDPFIFNNKRITLSGTYNDTLKTTGGCDSIVVLHIDFNQPSYVVLNKSICPNQHFTTPTGKRLNLPGIYYDTMINSAGCDSIFEIRLNVRSTVEVYDTATFIKGHNYQYRGLICTHAGIFYDTAHSVYGCDTFFQLVLTYEPYMICHIDAEYCDNYPFKFRGRTYTTTATDTFLMQSVTRYATDTLFIVNTVVHQHAETHLSDTTCDGNPYAFGGKSLSQSGIYRDTLATREGCDSIVILDLKVFDKMEFSDSATICETDTFRWHGRDLTRAGIHRDTIVNNRSGCNEYYEFILHTVKETKVVTANGATNEVTVCADEREYIITPTFTGTPPTRFSVTYDGVKAPHTNDITDAWYDGNTITLPIPMGVYGKIRPDHYTVTLTVGNDYCDASPYTVDYDLWVYYPDVILDQHFNDVVSILNANHNGGYTFTDYRWFVNGARVQGANGSNLYLTSLKAGDEVVAELLRTSETEFIPTCPIYIKDLGPEPQEYPVMLNGTYNIIGKNALISSQEKGEYRLYDLRGMLISSGIFEPDTEIEVPLPYVSGCYLLSVKTESYSNTFKLVVR